MTPFLSPSTPAEQRYNQSLCRTRVLIEQTFGVLKRRFQCLHHEIATEPNQAITYIVACAVLHNLGIQRGDVKPNPDGNVAPINDDLVLNHGRNDGLAMRQHIVNNFFKIKLFYKFNISNIMCSCSCMNINYCSLWVCEDHIVYWFFSCELRLLPTLNFCEDYCLLIFVIYLSVSHILSLKNYGGLLRNIFSNQQKKLLDLLNSRMHIKTFMYLSQIGSEYR